MLANKDQSYGRRASFKRLIDSHGVTAMQATPTTWRMLAESGWSGKKNLKILCGGEAMKPDLARLLLPRCGELWNMYGPTGNHRLVLAPTGCLAGRNFPRSPHCQHAVLRRQRAIAAGSGGHDGRAADWRRRSGAGLSEPGMN